MLEKQPEDRPSPQSIIDAINHCSMGGFLDLAELIKRAKITDQHDEIIEAWKRRAQFFNEPDRGVIESILAQK